MLVQWSGTARVHSTIAERQEAEYYGQNNEYRVRRKDLFIHATHGHSDAMMPRKYSHAVGVFPIVSMDNHGQLNYHNYILILQGSSMITKPEVNLLLTHHNKRFVIL